MDNAEKETERLGKRDEMPSRNYDTELDQLKAIQNKNRQKTRIQDSTAKYNKKASNYRGGTGHGVVMFSEVASVPAGVTRNASAPVQNESRMRENKQVLEQLDRDIAAERKRNKNAKKEMNEARRQLVGSRIADGKAHGIILYDERGNRYYAEGVRVAPADARRMVRAMDEGKSSRAMTIDSKLRADVVYPRNPTQKMMQDYLRNRDRSDMVGIDAPKGTRANVRVGTNPAQVKRNQSEKRVSTGKATKKTPAKVEREMIGPAAGTDWVVTDEGRTYVGDKWGNYDNAAMMTSIRGSTPRYEGPFAVKTAGGHTVRKAYFDPCGRTFNSHASKPGVKGTVIGKDYDPRTGRWAEALYGRSDDYIKHYISGMRLVSPAGAGSPSCRKNPGKR